jgi:hypothetical protein
LLGGMHAAIAWGGGPHWLLSENDANAYAEQLHNVSKWMPIPVETAQKFIDIASFVGFALMIETPRIKLTLDMWKTPRGPRRPQPRDFTAQVFQFHPQGGTPPPRASAAEGVAPGNPPQPPMADGPPDAMGGEGGPFGPN